MQQWTEDLISVDSAKTLDGLFVQRVRRSADQEAYRYFDNDKNDWASHTWGEMGEQVARWQDALEGEGLNTGDRVAVLLRNSPEWVMFDQAALGMGLVVVPLYVEDRPDNIAYILEDSATRLLLIQDAGRWKKLAPSLDAEGILKRVVVLEAGNGDNAGSLGDSRAMMAEDWLNGRGTSLRQRVGV
ncbi:MAG: AMP-binding protein, partial [Sedimenticola sp.]